MRGVEVVLKAIVGWSVLGSETRGLLFLLASGETTGTSEIFAHITRFDIGSLHTRFSRFKMLRYMRDVLSVLCLFSSSALAGYQNHK